MTLNRRLTKLERERGTLNSNEPLILRWQDGREMEVYDQSAGSLTWAELLDRIATHRRTINDH
jgi:hypothetical protein